MPDVYKQSFKQNYTNNIELSIFNCGLERCAPGQTWGPGIRDHYLIHLVVSGKGIFEVGGRTWEVSEGDLFFARPSQLIRYTADEQQPWEYSWVGFNGACAHKLAAQLPFTDDAPVHHTSDPDGMRAALTNIYSSRGLQPQDEAAMVGYLYLFIAALMRETSAGKPHTASSSSQYVLNAIKYIQFNYSHDISIDDVAKSVGVSRSHLYRVFMLNVGDIDSAEISDALMQGWGIATRPGAHCAPLMHRALGTERQGVVRFSFGYFNTDEEVDAAIEALRDLAC